MPLWSVQIVGVHAPTFAVGEHVTIDDQMRPGHFLRCVTAPAGDAFDTSIEPIVEAEGGLYAIVFAFSRAPLEGLAVRKRPAEVLGIARFFDKRGIARAFSLSFCLVLVWCLCGACADYPQVFCNVFQLGSLMFLTCRNASPSSGTAARMVARTVAWGISRSCSTSVIVMSRIGIAMLRKISTRYNYPSPLFFLPRP